MCFPNTPSPRNTIARTTMRREISLELTSKRKKERKLHLENGFYDVFWSFGVFHREVVSVPVYIFIIY